MKNKISIIIILIMAVAIGVLTYKLVTIEPATEVKECEKQETPNLEVNYDEIVSLYKDFEINIDLLEKYNQKEITEKDFTNDDKLNIALTHILAHEEMYEESTFDNSDGAYAQNKQVKITIEQIKKVIKTMFGNEKFEHLPDLIEYDPFLIEFKKEGDHYIGKQIISGHIGGPGYIYYLNGYDIKDNKILINIVAGYIYTEDFGVGPVREEGLYKNKEATDLIVPWNSLDAEYAISQKEKLTNIQYIFDITEEGYQLNKITIN